MANQRESARANWGTAQKIRTDMMEKLQGLTKERGTVNYTTRFEEAEQNMAQFRLACMTVIFHDFEYAATKKVEHSLWTCHTFLNGEYRKALGRLNTPSQVVQRRKLDKLYRGFLKTSEQFYFVYIQQLYNRFSIPELRQIACKSNKPQLVELETENASPPAPLRTLILKSCHMTLVRLGDLVRYRCQLSDKFSKATFETASDYYSLANSLDPEDGSAHHQLAVLHKIPGQHFDIVYHFHRAIAVSRPHELALQNLEREFKSPENSYQARKGPAKDQSQAMVSWFVQLHAFYYHGKNFSRQDELEKEVLHRLEIAFKSENSDNTLLLKMILVNMAAYDISTQKVNSSWTMEGSQSCQFLLRFNIRTMLILSRLLDRTLCDNTPATTSGGKAIDGESCISFPPSLIKLLPLFRLYIAWSYVSRSDLVQYQEYLEPYVKDLYRLLADILTSLNKYIDMTMDTVSSKYLLPEDNEAQGIRPLNDRILPLFLCVEEQQRFSPPKSVKIRKPQQNVFGRQFKQETEAVWRIRDIVCCGVFLAGSVKFPVALTTQTQQGRDTETWIFVDGTTAASNEATLSCLLNKLNFGDTKSGIESTVERVRKPQPSNSKNGPMATPGNAPQASVPSTDNMPNKGKGKSSTRPSTNYLDSDLSEDSEMINMVNKLLDPVDHVRSHSSQAQGDSSYGMHSSTANEIFGNLESSPMQPSPVSKAIPNLPWDYFYKPTPHLSSNQEQNQLISNGHDVPRSASGRFNRVTSSPYLDDLSASYQQLPTSLSPRPNTGYMRDSPILTTSSPGLYQKDYSNDSLEDSRSAVLDSLRSALLAQHGLSSDSSSNVNPLNRASPVPTWGQENGTSERLFAPPRAFVQSQEQERRHISSYRERSVSHLTNAMALQNPLGPPGRGKPEPKQATLTNDPDHSPTTMKSAYHEADNQYLRGQGSSHNTFSSWSHQPFNTTGSSPIFSNPSSLIVGTPGVAPANSVACNGHYYNATTPFGRSGDGVNNRTDPTHFRNQMKTTVGTSEFPYDQQILQAAMMGNNHKPRPK
ncbi:hypothetical protein F5B22DRAFT_632927 [Xylaria bambusicola]|uniref:uncharacterized protein n=1 Tax=Xylaria bambusicola TaxID=326684 RepID=UPI0020084B85|nr:uncharacterized protein F5B22DRAFT_632927 [Xylaria bambusicola]KAI0526450.1 hypothetical protein F5B22DRAFT_632927 [Xylaria bambusicola]